MERKYIKYGNHRITNDTDGYIYSFNSSDGYNFNSHMHKCYEFIHVLQGKLLYTVDGTDYMLSAGDFIMTKPEELHSFSFPEQCNYQREFLHIYPGFIKDFPEIISSLNSRKQGSFNYIPAEIVKKYEIDKIFNGIREYCSVPVPETDFMVLTYTLQLITKVNQIIRIEFPMPMQVATNRKSNFIYDYIDHHYNEDISLTDIAEAAFMSPAYASRMFKKETGMTIKAYLNLRRVTHAKNLIMEGKKATSIYSDCGFCDYSTFYRAFIKFVGITPDEFKHNHTTNNRRTV